MRRQSMPHEPVRAPIQSSTSNGSINEIFRSLAYKTADVVGSPYELIRSIKDARNGLLQLENLPDETIQKLQQEFDRLGIAEEEADQCVRDDKK